MILRELGPVHDWPALRRALEDGTGPVALTLSPALVAVLEDSDTRTALKRLLGATGRRVLAAVLDDSVLPGWGRPYRAALAIGAAELLEDLNPQRTLIWVVCAAPDGPAAETAYLIRVAAFCHDLKVQTRRSVCLTLYGAGPGLADRLFTGDAVRTLAGLAGIGPEKAGRALADHIGLARPVADGLALPQREVKILANPTRRAAWAI